MERYTEKAKKALMLAGEAAEDLGSRSIGTEHLLVGLIEEGTTYEETVSTDMYS